MLSDLRRVYTVPLRVVNNAPMPASLPQNLQFTGLELLLDVGLACTRPEMTDDPERLFALLRYGTKLSPANTNLRLKGSVAELDSHKKKVLSDEFGCGFAFLAARRLLNTSVFLDTTTARRQGLLTTTSTKSQQPDYIGMNHVGGELIVLEAKGTQTKGYCRKQVRAGCGQVTKVNFKGGVKATRIAIGTELQREDHNSNTTIFVGDPEEAEGNEYVFNVLPQEAIVRSHYARIAALIGDADLLGRVAEYPAGERSDLQKSTLRKRVYVGSGFQFRYRNSLVGLFVGIDNDFRRRAMETKQYKSILTEHAEFTDDAQPVGAEHFTLRPDGTVLQLWAKGPLSEAIRLA